MLSTAAESPWGGFSFDPSFFGCFKERDQRHFSLLCTSSFLNIAKIMRIFLSRPPFLISNRSSKPEGLSRPFACQTWGHPMSSSVFIYFFFGWYHQQVCLRRAVDAAAHLAPGPHKL